MSVRAQNNIDKVQKCMPMAGFEPPIPVSERPQTYALDRVAAGIGLYCLMVRN